MYVATRSQDYNNNRMNPITPNIQSESRKENKLRTENNQEQAPVSVHGPRISSNKYRY